MIDKGPLSAKTKYGGGSFGATQKLKGKRKKNAALTPPKMASGINKLSARGGVRAKTPTDFTAPANKGLVKANTPERKAAVLSELAKIDTRTASKAKLGQAANLRREKAKYGW